MGGETYAIACLREGGKEFCALDLFINSIDTKFAVKGKATVHLTGYFEADEGEEDVDDMEDHAEVDGTSKAASKKTETTAMAAKTKSTPKSKPEDGVDEEEEEED